MIKLESLGGFEPRRALATAFTLAWLSSLGGCSVVADFGALTAVEADGGSQGGGDGSTGDGDGSAGDGGSMDDGGGSMDDGGGSMDDGGGSMDDGGGDGGCTPQYPAELIAEQGLSLCDNDIDDDCDGLSDCEDPDCFTLFACGCTTYNGPAETACDDGLDDDCKQDGVDCEDPDCVVPGSCGCAEATYEDTETTCGDGVDNDCDGVADCDDDNCRLSTECCPDLSLEGDGDSCDDGKDNDCDGLVDCADEEGCGGRLVCCVPADGQSTAETECSDGDDDDCDGLADCEDPDCALTAACCSPSGSSESSCSDQTDNDCDGDVDCGDSDCADDVTCIACMSTGSAETLCDDGRDDDCDGPIDCKDADCAETLECCVPTAGQGSKETSCGDGKDNDCDGQMDCADDDCVDAAACCVPSATEESTEALCDDGKDNDCKGGIDCGDGNCAGATACCEPKLTPPQSEASVTYAANGVDDDCDGRIDAVRFGIPQSFPQPGGAASAADVAILILPNEKAKGIECRVFRRGGSMGEWGTCAFESTPGGLVFMPHAMAAPDGAYTAQIRWVFEQGSFTKFSEVGSYDYYVHQSLDTARRCDDVGSKFLLTSDERLTDFALSHGGGTKKKFVTSGAAADTSLLNPFIKLTFDEPRGFEAYALSGPALTTYNVMSLRRWFRLSADGSFLIMTRRYESSRNGSCYAATFRKHRYLDSNSQERDRYHCDAVVIHRTGGGVCVNVSTKGALSLGHSFEGLYYVSPRRLMNGWNVEVNPVMGRQLTAIRSGVGLYENFSDKCHTEGCGGRNRPPHYLPDVAQFDWGP